jgi:hypothetical protein
MGRRYQVGPEDEPRWRPSASSGADLRGVRERHWELLSLLAQYAVLDTGQVAELMFGSRPAAVRHLSVLVKAGLVWRFVYDNDASHRAHYEASREGLRHLAERLHQAGQTVPANLGHAHRDQVEVNEFMIRLERAARASHGQAWLYGWRRGADVLMWLHRLGITGVQPRAAGVWLQDSRAVRFLLHVDDDSPSPLSGTPALPPAHALRGYRQATVGVPAACLLMLCPTVTREDELHTALAADPMLLPIASTTLDRLLGTADPSEAIWSTATAKAGNLIRLIDTAGAGPY